jgi:hypothetical protein
MLPITMKTNCKICEKEYEVKSSHFGRVVTCGSKQCRSEALSRAAKRNTFPESHRAKLRANHADVSGKNNPMWGKKRPDNKPLEENKNWKNGIGVYRREALRSYGVLCNRCDSSKKIIVHHIDGNRFNNPLDGSNWEVLCRSCHEKHHQRGKRKEVI